jgi:hypothetical protein
MPNHGEGKRPKTRKDKEAKKHHGKPTAETEHPVMETHPGAREPDPVTGEKPEPVKKPRVKKPKPEPKPDVEEGTDS